MPIITGKEDANFSVPNGKYKFFTCSKEVLNCNDAVFHGDAVLLSGNGDIHTKYYSGDFNAYQRTYVLIAETPLYFAATYFVCTNEIQRLLQRTSGSIIKFITKGMIERIPVLITDRIELYERLNLLLKQCLLNKSEIESLTKQRDELLPLLMNGQVSVNYDLPFRLQGFVYYIETYNNNDMNEIFIQAVMDGVAAILDNEQMAVLREVLANEVTKVEILQKTSDDTKMRKANEELLAAFISSKKIEGCSDKTLHYYQSSINKLLDAINKSISDITTNDIRCYLAKQQEKSNLSKVTVDNLRRIFSSFFSWLEDEDYIPKSPVRRIHKVRTDSLVKEVLSDENLETLRDNCKEIRDLAMIDLLASTGMRVGELVKMNRDDIDFQERQCVVFGKGNKEREVYFNARTKIHLRNYLDGRTDDNPALFVSLSAPHSRLTVSGVEVRLRNLGKQVNIHKVHPHKFRRTLATMAIDKGMPIEQVQKLLGHVKIDTTLHYAMVNQQNVKLAHRKFIN